MKKIFFLSITIGVAIISIISYQTNALTWEAPISFELQPGYLFIGATGNITLSAITSWWTTGYATGTFSQNAFRVEDQKGNLSGYYTVIQASNLVWTGGTISSTNILLQASGTVTLIAWSSNSNVKIWSGINNKTGIIANPMTYFYRKNTGANLLGRYGDTPQIQVVIPPGTPAWIYTGKIFFTLIINQ